MDIIKTKIDGVYVLIPRVFGDYRGFFMESWSKKTMDEAGLFYDFVQDNHSLSTVKGTLRGIHFQKGDKSQAKLVRVVTGAVLDVGHLGVVGVHPAQRHLLFEVCYLASS